MGETVGATTVVGGGLLWVFREKLAAWVRGQTRERLRGVEERVTSLEKGQANHEGELMRVAEALERTGENMSEAMHRMTAAIERIVESHEETKADVSYIRGRMDAQSGPEFRQGPRL